VFRGDVHVEGETVTQKVRFLSSSFPPILRN
jgi:hypothetical protein